MASHFGVSRARQVFIAGEAHMGAPNGASMATQAASFSGSRVGASAMPRGWDQGTSGSGAVGTSVVSPVMA